MIFEQFDKFQADLFTECVGMKDTKGKEYANATDRFANFKRIADELDLPPVLIGWVYTKKHLDGIASYVKNGREFSTEKIRGRIVDAIVYLTLIAGMIEENKSIEIPTKIVASNMDGIKCSGCQQIFLPTEKVVTCKGEKYHNYCMEDF